MYLYQLFILIKHGTTISDQPWDISTEQRHLLGLFFDHHDKLRYQYWVVGWAR